MPGYNIAVHPAKETAPCGLEISIPFTLYSALKAAGGEILVVDDCPKCRQEHRLVLNPLTNVTVSLKAVPAPSGLEVLRAPLAGNGRQG